jgi:hypothetical protein
MPAHSWIHQLLNGRPMPVELSTVLDIREGCPYCGGIVTGEERWIGTRLWRWCPRCQHHCEPIGIELRAAR